MKSKLEPVLAIVYTPGSIGTFGYLTFFDGYTYNWWNWIIALSVNSFLSGIWPLYWAVIRWLPKIF
jgi:hypothetical protein